MAKMFREQGYATACIGKWHLGYGREAFGDGYYNAHIGEIERFLRDQDTGSSDLPR